MSAGKRLAKRSIVGTRVCALYKENGLYHPGVIIGSKNPDELNFHNCHTGITSNSRYVVRFETGETREFSESELIGPGFGSVNSLKLRPCQKTFVTHNGREVSGTVVYHRPQIDEVLINILPQCPGSNEIPFDVTKKLDEVRLLESRKSARLQEQDFDFARLADVADRKRNQQTASIDVPRNTNMSRKRRPSSGNIFQPMLSLQAGDDVMDECAAAMVLMSLSCSPHSPQWENSGMISSSWSSSSSSGASSWLSNNGSGSGLSGSGTLGEMHYNNCSPTPSSSDDGIESDSGDWDEPRKKKTKLIFKCTWPGCSMVKESCFEIEAHVRYAHLGPKNEESGDHEEEFYYTEEEVSDLSSPAPSSSFGGSSGVSMAFSPTLSHMDMVRPPSEDPEYKLNQQQRKSPNGNTHLNPKKRLSPKSSPVRRPRGDTKKCRKVYGMERRDQWCTQCKWKKACTRFGD
ncbi:unnamed protein product [Allacma fusca]|uniref:DUF4772 domain-containing protein n=1 Tax=Allacma fusca TaxID=39272 RepID=A0A8J2Q1B8_9HEXA|nr:unnamed protein product [Allacma fusca]